MSAWSATRVACGNAKWRVITSSFLGASCRRGIFPALPAAPGLPAQHLGLEAKQSSERVSSLRAPASLLGVCPERLQEDQASLQQLKSWDLGEAKNTIPAPLKQVTYLFHFSKQWWRAFFPKKGEVPLQLKKQKCPPSNFYLKQMLGI